MQPSFLSFPRLFPSKNGVREETDPWGNQVFVLEPLLWLKGWNVFRSLGHCHVDTKETSSSMYLISIQSITARNKLGLVYMHIHRFIQQTPSEPDYAARVLLLRDSGASWRNRRGHRQVMATTSTDNTDCRVTTRQVTGSFQALLFINLTTLLGDKYDHCPHFSDRKTEAPRALPDQSHTAPGGRP